MQQSIGVNNGSVTPMDKSIYSAEYGIFLKTIRDIRKKANITQEHLAEKLGTTQTVISKCERGERRLDVIELRAWCRALGIEFEEFASLLEAAIKQR